ncbi:MAG: hypothetical protein LJF15_16970 [Acidobacteria bacterium]|jgi:hypothetical protein|nr:hypothetical protein [Acidobacteriota bacterium]
MSKRAGFVQGVVLSALLAVAAHGQSENPARPGFDREGSDPEAMAVADEVMKALGGRAAWDRTRFVTWSFFGRRTHVWDRYTGNLRFEDGETLVLMNLNTKRGRAWKEGSEVKDPAELKEILTQTESAWINDSYWVFMPYKLKDTGVTLKHLGEGRTEAGSEADVLELTFKDVGRTPENKYHVYVDKETRLVTQWDYYPKASDPEPAFKSPWKDWKKSGGILLSASRGERSHENLTCLEDVPDAVFESPDSVDVMQYAVR